MTYLSIMRVRRLAFISGIILIIDQLGGLTSTAAMTEDGFEQTYQSNHLSHVLLTHTFLNRGRFVQDARIVSISSVSFYGSHPLDERNVGCSDLLDPYNSQHGAALSTQDSLKLYSRSKAAQAVWTMALQRRLSRTEGWKNISAHSCHPGKSFQIYSYGAQVVYLLSIGTVKSSIWTQPAGGGSTTGLLAATFKAAAQTFGISSEQGAVVPVWLAVAPEPAKLESRGMYWDRLWNKWCEDAQVSLI